DELAGEAAGRGVEKGGEGAGGEGEDQAPGPLEHRLVVGGLDRRAGTASRTRAAASSARVRSREPRTTGSPAAASRKARPTPSGPVPPMNPRGSAADFIAGR